MLFLILCVIVSTCVDDPSIV